MNLDIDTVVIRRYVIFGIMLCLASCYVWHYTIFGIMLCEGPRVRSCAALGQNLAE